MEYNPTKMIEFGRAMREIAKTIRYVTPFTEEDEKALDLVEFWPDITGMSRIEINEISTRNVLLIVNKRLSEGWPNYIGNYSVLPNSAITKFIKNVSINKGEWVPMNKNVQVQKTTDLENDRGIYRYKANNESYEVIFNDLESIKKQRSATLRKTLNFILIKANQLNKPKEIIFDLKDYKKMVGYKSMRAAFKGVEDNFNKLMSISVEGTIKRGKREIRSKAAYIFIARDISYNKCVIECKPELIEMLSQYYTLLPTWAGKLNTRAYDILDYIFYMARQNQSLANIKSNKAFNISLKSINENTGNHAPEETKRHTEYIIDPIKKAIEDIKDIQKEMGKENLKIKIKNVGNYKNAHDFLKGYIQIKLDEEAIKYYVERRNSKLKNNVLK